MDKWINPTTVIALLGGIIWGVQMNMYVNTLGERTTKMEQHNKDLDRRADEASLAMAKILFVLDNLVNRIGEIESDERRRIEVDEVWRQRIIRNELDHGRDTTP